MKNKLFGTWLFFHSSQNILSRRPGTRMNCVMNRCIIISLWLTGIAFLEIKFSEILAQLFYNFHAFLLLKNVLFITLVLILSCEFSFFVFIDLSNRCPHLGN